MIIYYKKKRLNYQLYFGIGFLAIGIILVPLNNFSLIYFSWIIFGLLQLAVWYYEKKHQYLSIDKNNLTKNSIFPKSVKLNEIETIVKLEKSYILETKSKKIKINKDIIEEESFYKLNKVLEEIELKLKQEKNI